MFFGSLLVFLGFIVISGSYFIKMKDDVFGQMRADMQLEGVIDTPLANNLPNDFKDTSEEVDFSKYLGVLEIPKIRLKRGFYNIDSKYNDIEYNVAVVKGSDMPDIYKGNLILMAHSGNSTISYFSKLYLLKEDNLAFVTYGGEKYTYKLVKIYNVKKDGHVRIVRDYDKTVLTLITCTKDSDSLQTVYIFELV